MRRIGGGGGQVAIPEDLVIPEALVPEVLILSRIPEDLVIPDALVPEALILSLIPEDLVILEALVPEAPILSLIQEALTGAITATRFIASGAGGIANRSFM
jgi:hypothetical protein